MKKLSDSTLMHMTKAELIEQLRCAEHNQSVAEERLAQQAENMKDWVPVVRCKNCKYMSWNSVSDDAIMCTLTYDGFWRNTDDFCSYGSKEGRL